MIDCPDGYIPCDIKCPQCGGDFFDYRYNNMHLSAYCIPCNQFVKHVSKINEATWKRIIKERDGYICQKCGKAFTSRQLEAHHKMPQWFMPELKYDISNGITLCKECHNQLHGKDGTIKSNKED